MFWCPEVSYRDLLIVDFCLMMKLFFLLLLYCLLVWLTILRVSNLDFRLSWIELDMLRLEVIIPAKFLFAARSNWDFSVFIKVTLVSLLLIKIKWVIVLPRTDFGVYLSSLIRLKLIVRNFSALNRGLLGWICSKVNH